MRAIVVDDEKLALESMRMKLTRIERISEVHAFLTPEEALDYFEANGGEIAFLDIQMAQLDGLALASRMREIKPGIIIIFVTGYSEYAMDAMKIHADGYLMKPMSEEDIEQELDDVERRRIPIEVPKRIRVQCFGNFEVFVDGKPLALVRSKSKELLAFLVDRRGSAVTMAEIAAVLWDDGQYGASRNSQIHNFLTDITKAFHAAGGEDIILRKRNSIAVNTDIFDCDYYDCLNGNSAGINAYSGEYMANYSWAEFTTGELTRKYN